MSRTNHTSGTDGASRCSICRHPDREDLDRDLVLRGRTQADVARTVGVDRSAVSRHVKNHVLPTLAETVLLESTDVALGNIGEAFESIYAEGWRLYHLAVASGDLKLAHALLADQRKLLEVVVRLATQMKGANLQDIIGRDEAASSATRRRSGSTWSRNWRSCWTATSRTSAVTRSSTPRRRRSTASPPTCHRSSPHPTT